MLEVILTILKVLGIIILSLLGIIISLLLLVLFVPIRYNIKGEVNEGYMIKAKVTWLLHIVYVGVGANKDDGVLSVIRIFGIKIFPKKEKKKKGKKEKKKKTVTDETAPIADEMVVEETVEVAADTKEADITVKEEQPPQEDSGMEKESEPKSKKIKKEKKSIKEKLNDIKNKFNRIKTKLTKLVSDASYWIEFINDEQTKSCIGFLFSQIKDLLKKLIPKKHSIYLRFGSGDPCSTGQITGYASVAKTVLSLNLDFVPDFENKVIESKFYFKGHLRVISLLIIAIKIYKNKDFRKVLNTLTK
ncbi:MAG: DUF2953 domain-containing protein [Lachnospira sp.]|nr:DUF2953 domain-containing protein [Lachnospira sp.]